MEPFFQEFKITGKSEIYRGVLIVHQGSYHFQIGNSSCQILFENNDPPAQLAGLVGQWVQIKGLMHFEGLNFESVVMIGSEAVWLATTNEPKYEDVFTKKDMVSISRKDLSERLVKWLWSRVKFATTTLVGIGALIFLVTNLTLLSGQVVDPTIPLILIFISGFLILTGKK